MSNTNGGITMAGVKSKLAAWIAITFIGITTMLSYQNCGRVSFQAGTVEAASAVGPETIFACNLGDTEPCQVGAQIGTRTCVASDAGPQWGACIVPPMGSTTTTTLPGNASCLFQGVTYAHGQSFTAYQFASVPASGACTSQVRTCINGSLTGSYQNLSCIKDSGECSFAGQKIAHGQSITAYAASSVPFGSTCASQNRLCQDRVLSGTYSFISCSVQPAGVCNFNGQTVAHGTSVTAYQASSVPFGSTCASQARVCNNGVLGGTYTASSCSVAPAASCSFNGQMVAHGASVTAFQAASVAYGSTCASQIRTCNNGTLSGNYAVASCSVAPAAACSFNGQSVAHNASVTAYQTANVPFGSTCSSQSRTCNNGTLSGAYTFGSCSVNTASTCVFNGQTIAHGTNVTAYAASSVPFGQNCQSQVRSCSNGTLSGTYTVGSCSVQAPVNCSFNGQTVNHGATVTAYAASSVAFGSTCQSESRTCTNGSLSGTYTVGSCSVQPPANCSFNGQTVNHGASVTAYTSSSVAYGANCSSIQQTRTCSNGVLSGSGDYGSCSALPPANCSFNGQTVAHGASVTAFETTSVMEPATCSSQTRTCNNGSLSGSHAYPSCSVTALPYAQCNVFYQYFLNGDFGSTGVTSNGAWAQKKNQDQNYNCTGAGCGLKVGVSCTGSAEVKLTYQYQEFSTPGIEQSTPWSGTDGQVRWGSSAILQRSTHPKVECGNGLNCGLRVSAETRNGKPCTVSYQYRAEGNRFSPIKTDGDWSLLSGVNGGDNCDDGYCGIQIKLNCGGSYAPTPGVDVMDDSGGGSGGGGSDFDNIKQF